jgi:hypothetical protein
MPARRKQDLGPFEGLVTDVRRHEREAAGFEERLVKALNAAYCQGAADVRKAISGVDPRAPRGGESR